MKKTLHAVKSVDHKGRIVIPKKLRKHAKYLVFTSGKYIVLEGCKDATE